MRTILVCCVVSLLSLSPHLFTATNATSGQTAVDKAASSKQQPTPVVLLDTTSESSLDWTRYPYGPSSRTPGWVEESFTNFEQGINWRSYVVCDVAYQNVNNWLWTPFIERRDANRMYIEIKFSMRDCNLFPGMALSCKETFSLLYYEFDAQHKEPPPWEPESYKLIDRIAADEGRFTSNQEVIINTEVRSIPVTKKGVYFAFRDQGACLSLIAIKVYYMVCPNITANFAYFPETPTGKELTSIVSADGTCVPNSVQVEKPRLLCKGDGNWTLPSGGCRCLPGYEADPLTQRCRVCPASTYKSTTSNDLCQNCPDHSKSLYRGATECRCDQNHGYYRAAKDPKWFPCTQPPSAPQNLTANFVDGSTVLLTWAAPKYLGGRNDTVYRVECETCTGSIAFHPSHRNITNTKVVVSNLNPQTTYRFLVYAENGVSQRMNDVPQSMDITIKTTESSVSWQTTPGSYHSFSLATARSESPPSSSVTEHPSSPVATEEGVGPSLATTSLVVLLMLSTLVAVSLVYLRRDKCRKKQSLQSSHCDTITSVSSTTDFPPVSSLDHQTSVGAPLFTRSYVDVIYLQPKGLAPFHNLHQSRPRQPLPDVSSEVLKSSPAMIYNYNMTRNICGNNEYEYVL